MFIPLSRRNIFDENNFDKGIRKNTGLFRYESHIRQKNDNNKIFNYQTERIKMIKNNHLSRKTGR